MGAKGANVDPVPAGTGAPDKSAGAGEGLEDAFANSFVAAPNAGSSNEVIQPRSTRKSGVPRAFAQLRPYKR